jgi:hypothetical protein
MTAEGISILLGILTFVTVLVAVGPDPLRHLLSRFIPSLDPQHLSCRILQFEQETESGYSDLLKIQMQGQIRAAQERCDTDLLIQLMDVTDSAHSPKPVLCRRQEWTTEDSPANEYRIHNGVLPARVSILTDWVTVMELNVSELVFPRRGPCTLECTLSVIEKSGGRTLAAAKGRIGVISGHRGYEEIQQQRHTKQTATLQLALCIWHLTGRDPAGREILQQWIHGQTPAVEQIPELDGSRQDQWIEEASDSLLGWADPADRYTAVELCLKIAAAGANIQKPLIERLQEIADKLEIPKDRFHALSQKYLTGRVGQMENPMVLLGLSEEMSDEQILSKLTDEYRKWNARVTHPDSQVRQQADQMLNLIAQLRSRHARRV